MIACGVLCLFGCGGSGTSSSGSSSQVSSGSSLAFSAPRNFNTGGSGPTFVQTTDLNGDGKLDLVIVNSQGVDLAVLLGNGDGTFQPAATYGLGGGSAAGGATGGATVADFNHDGKPDIAVIAGGIVSVFLNQGNGTFLLADQLNVSTAAACCIGAADLNKDGNQDLWVGGDGDNFPLVPNSAVLLGNGDGTFQTPRTYQLGIAYATSVAIADLNGDGNPDLLEVALLSKTPAAVRDSAVGVMLNQGNANFGPSPFGNAKFYSVGSGGEGMAIGDLNGDGKPDVAVTDFDSNQVSVLLGNGDGTFKSQSIFAVGNKPLSIALADFAGTGHLSMVLTTQPNAMDGNGVQIYLGNGDGTFTFYQGLATGSSPLYVTVGDFNGDGVPDIAVVDNASGVVSILLTQRLHP
jgi:hypothetical protein